MKQVKIILAVFGAVVLFAVFAESCTYKKEGRLVTRCDTSNAVTYKLTVEPVLRSNCLGCHNNVESNGNVSLEGYNNVKQVAISGKLVGVISHSQGFKPMPIGGNKLDECTISGINRWVKAGTPNN
jgi:hypothetical protein